MKQGTISSVAAKFHAQYLTEISCRQGRQGRRELGNYHTHSKSLKGKIETYLKEYKHRMGILQETPRAAEDQEQQVIGLFLSYDALASFNL